MRCNLIFYVLAAAILTPGALHSQSAGSRGAIEGRVLDTTGAAITDARVTAIQSDSGLERETNSSADGTYRIPSLLPGPYELRVESGTVGAIVRDVNVRVGATSQVEVRLANRSDAGSVAVTASVLSIADSEMTQVITYPVIRDLPANGRRFHDFATLTPAVLAIPETASQLSFVGQRGVHSNVLIDGTDYNQPYLGGIRGGDRADWAFTIPQGAISEFQMVTSGYSAEYGRSTGGVLNAITRAGTNEYHGEGFYLMRHRSLSASTVYGQDPLENQQQVGGAFGGPIMRNRLFFFGAAEQQISRAPRRVRFSALDSITRTPDIAPAYDLFRSLERDFDQTNDAAALFGRLDYRFASHVIAGRYNWSENTGENAVGVGPVLEQSTNRAFSNQGTEHDLVRAAAMQATSVFRPSLLNDFRAQSSFEYRRRMPNERVPFLSAGSIGQLGVSPLLPMRIRDRRIQFVDAVTWLGGGHAIKVGADYSRIDVFQWSGDNQFGAFIVTASDPRRVLQILSGPNRFDDPSVIYRRQVGGSETEQVAHQTAFFVQDTWRVLPNFTLNAGVRWEAQINPKAITDNEFLVNNVVGFNFPLGQVNPTKIRNHRDQWAPRLGFAWNPGGHTVIRAQSGLFYGQVPFLLLAHPLDSFSNAPADLSLEIAPNANGTVYRQFQRANFDLSQGPLNRLRVFTVPEVWMNVAGQPNPFAQANVVTTSGENFRNPRSAQLSVGVQHQLLTGLTVDYQMNYVNTVNLIRNVDYNVPRPFVRPGDLSLRPFFGLRSGVSRPIPNLGQVLVRDSNARSRYTGHSFRVQWQRSRFDLAANYTLAFNRSDDDGERSLSGITYQNPFDLRPEYNWSSIDVRHMAAGYMIWRAPFAIDVAGTFRVRSGLPIDATTGEDTSELLSGALGNRPLIRPGEFYARNSFRNRGFSSIDMRILKGFRISEFGTLQLSAEAFNLFNNSNVAFLPSTVLPNNPAFRYGEGILTNGQLAPVNPEFLRVRNAAGAYDPETTYQQTAPRQLQLGVRFLF